MGCSSDLQDPNLIRGAPPSPIPTGGDDSISTEPGPENPDSDARSNARPCMSYRHQLSEILAACLVLGLSLVLGLQLRGTSGNPQPTPTARPTATSTATATPAPTSTSTASPTATSTPYPRAYSAPTALRIPRIDVDAGIVEVGLTTKEENGEVVTIWEVAKFAAGFHRGSAYPGHPGNTVLSGHVRSRESGNVFLRLSELEPGDDVYLYADGQEFRYVVTQQMLLKDKGVSEENRQENARWIQPTDDERLTLISCWPPVKPDHRVVVIACPAR